MTPSRVVFLDRDGVLIRTYVRAGVPTPRTTRARWRSSPGSLRQSTA